MNQGWLRLYFICTDFSVFRIPWNFLVEISINQSLNNEPGNLAHLTEAVLVHKI